MASSYAQRKALGDYGERLAARHLVDLGFALLAQNWRCGEGEVDIIAADGDILVGCEVKTRTSTRYGSPLEAVDLHKADRVRRLVRRWASEQAREFVAVRLDVVAVMVPRRGRPELQQSVGVG